MVRCGGDGGSQVDTGGTPSSAPTLTSPQQATGCRWPGSPPLYQEQKYPLSLNVRMQGFYPLSSVWIFVLVLLGIKMVHYVNSQLSLSQYHVLRVIVAIFFLSFPIKFPLVICSQASILDMEIAKIY